MLGRLLIGILKGLLVGALLGFGLVKLGFPMPGALFAYLAAALNGVVVGLIAGKPIWAKDAKIEAGMKAFVGALLGVGLMAGARTWLVMLIPAEITGPLSTALQLAKDTPALTLGGFAMTSLAGIAGILGGFYEADNDPSDDAHAPPKVAAKAAPPRRIAPVKAPDLAEEDLDAEPEKKRTNT
jgi:hypothetical protein